MRRGGKVVVLCLAAACLSLAAALWVLRERIAEEWWLRKLEAAERKEERDEAVRRLAELRSARAVPRLLGLVEKGRPLHIERQQSTVVFPCYAPGTYGSGVTVSRRVQVLQEDQGEDRELVAALKAIVTARAEESLGRLLAALKDRRLPVQRRAVELLGALGPRAERAVPALAAMLDPFIEDLEAEIVDALERIGGRLPPEVRDYLVQRGWQ